MDFSEKKTAPDALGNRLSSEQIEELFMFWLHSEFEPFVVSDYTKVLNKFSSESGQYDVSCENKVRNIARGYKRDIRFKLMQMYAEPFGLPFTQTFAMQLMQKLFGEKACSVSVNKAFACKERTSKEPRVRFKPVVEAVDEPTKAFYERLYREACEELEDWLQECKILKTKSRAMSAAQQAANQSSVSPTINNKMSSAEIMAAAVAGSQRRIAQKKKPLEGASSQSQYQLF